MSLGRLRSWIFTIPVAVLITAVMITLAVLTSVVAPSGVLQRFWYRAWAAMVLFVFRAKVRVVGAERLNPDQNYVIASNHASLVDTPVLLGGMPIPFKFLAKQELLRVPFIGWYLRRAGHLTVSRGSIRSSIESMNEAARLIGERHVSVLIFPEGTRSAEGMQKFKEGAAYLAIAAGVPMAPVALVGTGRVLPAKSSHFRAGTVELRIGEPVSTAGRTLKDRAVLTTLVEQRVREMLERESPRDSTSYSPEAS